jgi:prepilin-type N-terminal cleavage/methylation domain-containing protein
MVKTKSKSAFTLIEIMIVILIISILTMWIYAPYNLYSNISKVKISKEMITQSINEARNSAAWLIDVWTQKNVNIWLIFEKWKNTVEMISFPFDYTWAIEMNSSASLVREIKLEDSVNINQFIDKDWNELPNGARLYFKAPEWEMQVYKDSTNTWSLKTLVVWFKNATSWILSRTITIK